LSTFYMHQFPSHCSQNGFQAFASLFERVVDDILSK
jgi:hypothetical protein